jgi:glycerol-3-phosphate O-acyltransferase
LLRVIKAIPLLKVNFGRVYVEISDPIFLSDYLKSYKENQKYQSIQNTPKPGDISKQLGL